MLHRLSAHDSSRHNILHGRLYHCFSLSLREVELILAARGIAVSYETIREWSLRFGRTYAKALKRRRPQPSDKWLLVQEICQSPSVVMNNPE
jgi:transposase-like protein